MRRRAVWAWIVVTLVFTSAVLSFSTNTGFIRKVAGAGGPYDVSIYPPAINGLFVNINGAATPGGEVSYIRFVWGDQSVDTGFFPMSHAYNTTGAYNITIIAFFTGGQNASTSTTVNVSPTQLSGGYNLTITAGPGGTISYESSVGVGTVYPGTPKGLYMAYAVYVWLDAYPDGGYRFDYWTATAGINLTAYHGEGDSALVVVESNGAAAGYFNPLTPISIGNNILSAVIADDPGYGVGSFTIRTEAGHPNPDQNVLFGGASRSPGSSFFTVQVADTLRDYVSTTSSPSTSGDYVLLHLEDYSPVVTRSSDTSATVTWTTEENLAVKLDISVHGSTIADTSVDITVTVENNDEGTHTVGLRHLWDLMVDGNDDSWIRPWQNPSTPLNWTETETEWNAPDFQFWETTNDLVEPVFSIYGWSAVPNGSPDPTVPDRFVYAAWSSAFDTAFDYTPYGGSGMDSAVLYYWNDAPIAPGQSLSRSASITTAAQTALSALAWPTDSSGNLKSEFETSDEVYLKGMGFPESTQVGIYVLPDGQTALPSNAVASATTTTTAAGNISTIVVWNHPLTPGEYDIWVDENMNGEFDGGDVWSNQAPGIYAFSVTGPTDTYTLTMYTVGQGSVLPGNSTGYSNGESVPISAIPAAGWSFQGWTGDASGSSNTTITITRNMTVTATFIRIPTYTLRMYTVGQGTVTPGNGTFQSGTVVNIGAQPAPGWAFQGWSGDATGSANTTVAMTRDRTVYATFIQGPSQYTLTVSSDPGGYTAPEAGEHQEPLGSTVPVWAYANPGYTFSHWLLDGALWGSFNPINVAMDGNHAVHAVFAQTQTMRTLNVSSTQGGSTNPATGVYSVANGSSINVTATSNAGYSFSNWLLDGANAGNANPITILMDEDHALQAVFAQVFYNLTVSSTFGGSTNPANGTYPEPAGSIVTVTATPIGGYNFSYWMLDGVNAGSANPFNVTMNQAHSIYAVFTTDQTYSLTVSSTTGGSTNPAPGVYSYGFNSTVQVTAMPSSGYGFNYWLLDGANVGSQNPISVTMNANHTLRAVFNQTFSLTISATAGGSTNPSPGTYNVTVGSTVQVTATAAPGYTFSRWLLDGVNAGSLNPISVTMNASHTLMAVFNQTVFLTVNAAQGGSTSLTVGEHAEPAGSIVQVTAYADSGYVLSHWLLDGAQAGTANPISVTMDRNHTLQPVFTQGFTLTILSSGGGSTNPAAGIYAKSPGSTVQVTATQNQGFVFSYWLLDGVNAGSVNPISVLMDKAHTLQPVFSQIIVPTLVNLVISQGTGGSTNPDAGTYPNTVGARVQVTATASSGYTFSYWLLDGVNIGSANPTTVTMDTGHTLKPVFARILYSLNIAAGASGSQGKITLLATSGSDYTFSHWLLDGVVNANNPITLDLSQAHTLQAAFVPVQTQNPQLTVTPLAASNAAITLTATADSGYAFKNWVVDGSADSSNPITVAAAGTHSVQAVFTQVYSLTISASTGGSTTPGAGTRIEPAGSVVQVSATASPGYAFTNWILDGVNAGNSTPISVTMNANHSLQAVFTQGYNLAISSGIGGSTNPGTGTHLQPSGSVVQVAATSSPGYLFSYWLLDGVNAGSTNPISVSMNSAHSLQAVFIQMYTLNVASTAGGSTSTEAGAHSEVVGSSLNVTATPSPGYIFSHWLLDEANETANPITVTMDGNHALTPVFTRVYSLIVSQTLGGSTVPSAGSFTHVVGSSAVLAAEPSPGYTFTCWTINGVNYTSNPHTLTMDQDYRAEAVFTLSPPVSQSPYQSPITSQSPTFSPTTSPSTSPSPTPTATPASKETAWSPQPENAIAATVVVTAVAGAVAVAAAAASNPAGIFGKLAGKLEKLIPNSVKKWVEEYTSSKRKRKISASTGSIFKLTRMEVLTYAILVPVMALSFAYVQEATWTGFLIILPTILATSLIIYFIKTFALIAFARSRGVWSEHRLWYIGLGSLILTTIAFKVPFAPASKNEHCGEKCTKQFKALIAATEILLTIAFGGIFYLLMVWGYGLIGGTGFAMCITGAFFNMYPVEPMKGRDIYKYSRIAWVAIFAVTLVLYGVWLLLM
ncbi:MAG: beta strand repeat-containing protein [Candidatus Bathyarchaeia archaeon]